VQVIAISTLVVESLVMSKRPEVPEHVAPLLAAAFMVMR
jgi:hypothetical protein